MTVCTDCGATFYSAAAEAEHETCPQCGGRLEADDGAREAPSDA